MSSSMRTIITNSFRCKRFSHRTVLVLRSFSSTSTEIPFYGLPRPLKSERANNQQQPCTLLKSSAVTDIVERTWLTWNNAITAAKDPTRADAVAAVGELTGRIALQNMLTQMQNDPIGRQILIDKPIVSKDTIPYERLIDEARQLKNTGNIIDNKYNNDITFGQAYGLFLLEHGFDPDERDIVKYIENDPELAYVMTRYRQCHDFWHTLTGLPITVSGEIGLKWLELFQTGLPMAALSCTIGSLFTLSNSEDRYIVWNIYLPWARKVHEELNTPLMNIYYEKEWDTSLVELRQRLNIQPAPKV